MPNPRIRSTPRFLLEGLEGAILVAFAVVTWPLAQHRLRNWGSRPEERDRHWPGDDLLPARVRSHTRAITIRASRRAVWRRLVQFGLDRAGFYSYELLERLGGIPATNVESVQPEWQTLAVGDEVLLHPESGVRVSRLEKDRAICFGKGTAKGEDLRDVSWSMYLEPEENDACRLVVRTCFAAPDRTSPLRRLAHGLEAALDAVMERRMLLTLRRLSKTVSSPGSWGARWRPRG